jgi:two-component system chemotaxis response regulator CheB
VGQRTEVLVVDDSPFIRSAVERMLAPLEGVEVIGMATNGEEAIRMTRALRPDLVILDIIMPEVDGLEAIRGIMETAPTPILVLSSEAQPGAETTLTALELGAVDFVSKSAAGTRMDIYDLAPTLREKVLAVAGSRVPAMRPAPEEVAPPRPRRAASAALYDLLALGASTGGPRALASILLGLPADFPAGVVIAQHMPPGFTRTLAERLDRKAAIEVREAEDGDPVRAGVALVGVGGRQLTVERGPNGLLVRVPSEPDQLLHRPSVDLLFRSVAAAAGPRAVAAVLTGMGQDGSEGLAALREAGGRTFAESEESAVIYGMPRAAARWAERVLPLDQLARAIRDLFLEEASG